MASIKERLAETRERIPLLDHVLRMVEHYGSSQGNLHAGAVTYFAFLSFFPLLALAFFAVGLVSQVYSGVDGQLRDGIEQILPNIIGSGEGKISLADVRSFSGLAGLLGLAGVTYTGLGFIKVLREALTLTFDRALSEASFVKAKATDLLSLLTIGGTILISVAVGSLVTRFSRQLLELVGLGDELQPLLTVLALLVSLGINALLFFVMFWRLVRSELPTRAMWSGALLGAVGFELLKQLSTTLIGLTAGNPSAQAFGIALALILVFNYFARLTLFAACWAYTAPAARAARPLLEGDPVQGPAMPPVGVRSRALASGRSTHAWVTPFAAGGAAALAAVAVLRRNGS